MFLILQLISLKPFKLQSVKTTKYIGRIDNLPAMVDPEHAVTFDIRTDNEHKNTLCTENMCLHSDYDVFFSPDHSTEFYVLLNDDSTFTFMHKNRCLAERGLRVMMDNCEDDRFNKIFLEPESIEYEYKKGEDDIIFNYGVEDTDHKRDSIVQMKKKDIGFTVVPRNRHHNSHTHKVGGFANKAYYTYYSYHPNARYSAWNFHGRHHGIPKSWNEDVAGLGNK